MPELPFGHAVYAAAAMTVAIGYLIFAITGFGAALLTVPVLSHFLPLQFVLPVTVLLDVSAALLVGARFHRDADRRELKWMVPSSLAGAVLGVTLLVNLPQEAGRLSLGAFLVLYAAYNLLRRSAFKPVSIAWAPVSGTAGGAMGTLFGIGAPPYAMYLSRRLEDKAAMRSTLSTMVLFSTGIRLSVFAVAGLVLKDRLVTFAALFPFVILGLSLGHRIHVALPRERVLTAISVVLIAAGLSLIVRVLYPA